jgi:V8-like Glu-specific endopeptidase
MPLKEVMNMKNMKKTEMLSVSKRGHNQLISTATPDALQRIHFGKTGKIIQAIPKKRLKRYTRRPWPMTGYSAIGTDDRRLISLRSRIGHNDDRRVIASTAHDPWCRICCLEITTENGFGYGTGWLVGPRTVITAGHCVFNPDTQKWVKEIKVIPGRYNTHAPFPDAVTKTSDLSSAKAWVTHANPHLDIGALHLQKSIGDIVGWFGYAALHDDELHRYEVESAGYADDHIFEGRRMAYHAGKILAVDSQRIYYDIDTEKGQSGSPVFLYPVGHENDPIVVATHTNNEYATPGHLGIEANSAPRILSEIFDLIQAWVKQDR